MADRAAGYSMPGKTINGNDLPLVYATVKEAVDRARAGGGPSLIEARPTASAATEESDRNLYRDQGRDRGVAWPGPDPQPEAEVTQLGRITNHRFAAIDARVEEEMAATSSSRSKAPVPIPSPDG